MRGWMRVFGGLLIGLGLAGTASATDYATLSAQRLGAGGAEQSAADVAGAGLGWVRLPIDLLTHDLAGDGTPPSSLVTTIDARVLEIQNAGLLVYGIINPRDDNDTWPSASQVGGACQYFAERYDGDGVNDLAGLKYPIYYWEICNEYESEPVDTNDPNWAWKGLSESTYLEFCQAARTAFKAANSNMQFSAGAIVGQPNSGFTYLIQNGLSVDFVSFHGYAPDSFCLGDARAELDSLGLQSTPIFITESAFYDNSSGTSATQRSNARWYPLSCAKAMLNGASKIFFAEFTANSTWTDSRLLWMTMIDKDGTKRPLYYSCQKFAALVGSATAVTSVSAANGLVSAVKFTTGHGDVYLVWTDSTSGQTAALSGLSTSGARLTAALPVISGDAVVTPVSYTQSTATVTDGTLTFTLSDDTPYYIEPLPQVTLSPTTATVAENGSALTLTVTLSAASQSDLTICLSADGTATAGSDYAALSGSVTIPAGATGTTFTVTPLDDSETENDETVLVSLTAGTGYALGSAAYATVTITDNESASNQAPIISAGPTATVLGRSAALTVTATDPDGDALTYSWSRVAGWKTDLYAPDLNHSSLVVSVSAPVDFTYRVTVSDGKAETSADVSFTITAAATNQTMATECFVSRFYYYCLNRLPDAAGLTGWADGLIAGNNVGADLAEAFLMGSEFAARTITDSEYIDICYRAFFGREPDAAGKAQWLLNMTEGVSTRRSVKDGFVGSSEFIGFCNTYGITAFWPARTNIEKLVTRFYQQCLNREPDAAGLDGWADALEAGTKTGADVAYGFVGSPEFQARTLTDTEYLNILYQAFFGRAADTAGLNGWLAQLAAGQSRNTVLEGFIQAQEFADLCQSYGVVAVLHSR